MNPPGPAACARTLAGITEVPMENCTLGMERLGNARQLGGCITRDGKTVKRNLLLRSAKLADASESDLARLTGEYKLRTIVDFRTPGEAEGQPDPVLPGTRHISIQLIDDSAGTGALAKFIPGASTDILKTVSGMLKLIRGGCISDRLYIDQVDLEIGKSGYARFFDLLAEHDGGAVLWHCTSGKDRTGVASALVLIALGVDQETVLRDFMLSNEFHARNVNFILQTARQFTQDAAELEKIRALAGVSRHYMEKMFAFAEEKHGSVLNYIQQEFRVSDAKLRILREKYLD